MPLHVPTLEIGVSIILLYETSVYHDSNGTRLSVKNLMNYIIGATILFGNLKGEDLLLPLIPAMIWNFQQIPFEFKRLQFPVQLAFQLPSINKAQWHSLLHCVDGINVSLMDCCKWPAHASESHLIYLCMNQKKNKIMYLNTFQWIGQRCSFL